MESETLDFCRDGEKLSVTFREFLPCDAPGIIACLKEEYGDTYLKKDFYREDVLAAGHSSGRCRLLVAVIEGEVAALLGLKLFSGEGAPLKGYEFVASDVKKKYRGLGLMTYMDNRILQISRFLPDMPSVFACVVSWQDVTQRSLSNLGFVPTGFLLDTMGDMRPTSVHEESPKRHLCLMVKPLKRPDYLRLAMPPEHEAFARKIYDALGCKADFSLPWEPLSGKSDLFVENDEGQQSVAVWLKECGSDLAAALTELHRRYASPLRTFNVLLDCCSGKAPAAYETLRNLGYFFAGLRPLAGVGEYMVLHCPASVEIDFGALKMIPTHAELRDYVQKYYESRCIL